MSSSIPSTLLLSGVIFDMDGTLIDSNPRWDQVGFLYLERYGLTPPEDFLYHVHTKPVPEIAVYLKETFGLDITPEALSQEVISLMDEYYRSEATPKAGVLQLIAQLEEAGIPYCVATAAERSHVEAGLATVGITGQKFVLTCTEVGADKRFPTVFEESLKRLGSDRATTAVVEDSLTALTTAKQAGFYTISVYDDSFAAREEEKQAIAHLSVRSPEELSAVKFQKA